MGLLMRGTVPEFCYGYGDGYGSGYGDGYGYGDDIVAQTPKDLP